MHDARHLGGNCGHRLAAQIWIVAISRDVAFELVPESVLTLSDGDLPGDPQGAAQPSIAELGKTGLASILAGLLCRQIQSAEFEKLTVMVKAAEISGLGNDRQRVDRPDAGYLSQELVILAVPQQFVGLRFDLIALPDQVDRTPAESRSADHDPNDC